MSAPKTNAGYYVSQQDARTDTPGVYRRGNHFRVLTRPDGNRKVMRRFETYEEAVAFKATTPNRNTQRQRKARYKSKGVGYLSADPCAYCGADSEHVDHIVPRAAGGSDEWDNLTASCKRCNLAKGTTSLLQFLLNRQDMPVVVDRWPEILEVTDSPSGPLFALLRAR